MQCYGKCSENERNAAGWEAGRITGMVREQRRPDAAIGRTIMGSKAMAIMHTPPATGTMRLMLKRPPASPGKMGNGAGSSSNPQTPVES